MSKLRRFFKHLFTTDAKGKDHFPPETLAAIEAAIGSGEKKHRAEVALIVEPALSSQAILRGISSRERAIELFCLHRIWDTEENCGVLVYVNLADHKVEIVADRSIERLVGKEQWQAICRTMTSSFAKRDYHAGTLEALGQINALLEQHFPFTGDRPNQLGNRPVVL